MKNLQKIAANNIGISSSWMNSAVSLQILAVILLFWSLIGQIRPADASEILTMTGPEGAFLAVFLCLFAFSRYIRLQRSLPLLLGLLVTMATLFQSPGSSGIIAWLMLTITAASAVLLACEHLLLNFDRRFFMPAFLGNGGIIVWLYLDRMFYTVSKTHLSSNHLQQIALIYNDLLEAVRFAGKGYLLLLAEAVVFIFAAIPAAMLLERAAKPAVRNGYRWLLLNLGVALTVLILSVMRFDTICSGMPVYEYLPLRLDLGVLTVPDHPALRADPELRGLLQVDIDVDDRRCFPANAFGPEVTSATPNLVMISVESLRRQEFASAMPRTRAWAEKGLWLACHQSVTNISLSSFHSIFQSSFPLNLPFSEHENSDIPFQKHLSDNGFRHSLILSSSMILERSSFWVGNLDLVKVDRQWQSTPAVLDRLLAVLKTPGRKAVHAYLFNLHFNYFYPPEAEKHLPVLPEDINLFLMQPEGENLQALRNRYTNAAGYTDLVLADFLDRAEAAGLFANTLFVIFGDHGESLGEAGFITHATGPHVKQFEVPVIFLGAGVKPRRVTTPTTHADLLPTICRLMGIDVKSVFGSDFDSPRDWPILQLDESVSGRIIVRHSDYMSIFDLADGRRLKWLATVSNEFTIDSSVAGLYTSSSFAALARVIKEDTAFIIDKIGRRKAKEPNSGSL